MIYNLIFLLYQINFLCLSLQIRKIEKSYKKTMVYTIKNYFK